MKRKRFPMSMQRVFILAITGFFWFVWLYLLAPLASLLLWFAGIRFFVTEMFDRGGYEALTREIINYGAATLVIFCSVLAWMLWNKKRYGNRNTRKLQPLYVGIPELSEFSGVKVSEIRKLQSSRQATVGFDDRRCMLVRRCAGKARGEANPADGLLPEE